MYTPGGLAITHFNLAFKSSAKKKDAKLDQGELLRKARRLKVLQVDDTRFKPTVKVRKNLTFFK
jgi:hypothetical protein